MEQITGNGKYQYNHTRKRQAKFQVNGIYYALPYGKVKGLLTLKASKQRILKSKLSGFATNTIAI